MMMSESDKSKIDLAKEDFRQSPQIKDEADEASSNAAGASVIPNYQFVDLIGQGGTSVVYKATHLLLNKTVAIKLLHPHLVSNDASLKRFELEANAISKLSHPNIVEIDDFGVLESGQPYIVMTYVDGARLCDLISTLGPLKSDLAVRIFEQVCDALEHAHGKGIVHRDLKPGNIMIEFGETERVRIVDFGIAKAMAQEPSAQRLTKTGEVFGSAEYMSPEQCTGRPVDRRSDIYSLGCVIYEALTGNPPIVGSNLMETIFKQVNDAPQPLRINCPQLAKLSDWEVLIGKALEKDADKRYQSAEELKSDLQALAAGKRLANYRRLKPTAKSITMLVIVVLIIIGSIMIFASMKPNHEKLAVTTIADEHSASKSNLKPLPVAKLEPFIPTADEEAKRFAQSRPPHAMRFSSKTLSNKGLSFIGTLKNLRSLNLDSSQIDDRGISSLSGLDKLTELDLSNTRISDQGVAGIARLRSLEELNLSGSDVTDAGVRLILALPRLTHLSLSDTRIGDSSIKTLKDKKLLLLNVSNTLVDKAGLLELAKMSSLQIVRLDELPSLTNDTLSNLSHLNSMQSLSLVRNNISGQGFDKIGVMPYVRELNLGYTPVADKDIASVVRALPNLRKLSLAFTPVTDAGLKYLQQANHLEDLDVVGSNVTSAGLKQLKLIPTLRTVHMYRSQQLGKENDLPFKVETLGDMNIPENQQ